MPAVISRMPALSPRARSVLLLAFLALVLGWSWWSATLAYEPGKPEAHEALKREAERYPDVFRHLPAAGLPRLGAGLLFVASALGFGHLALLPLRLRRRGRGERALVEQSWPGRLGGVIRVTLLSSERRKSTSKPLHLAPSPFAALDAHNWDTRRGVIGQAQDGRSAGREEALPGRLVGQANATLLAA